MIESLRPHALQHTRLPCPLPSPRVCSNSCPLSWWYHPAISYYAVSFSSCLQSFPASGSFPMSHCFASCGQSIGSFGFNISLPMNIQDWFPLGLTCCISSQSRGLSRVFSNTTVQKHQFFSAQPSLWSNFHICTWLLGRPQFLLYQNFVTKVMFLIFNMLSRFVIAFLAKSKHLVISWLQSLSTVILSHKKIVSHCIHCFPIYLLWSDGTRCNDLSFLNIEF